MQVVMSCWCMQTCPNLSRRRADHEQGKGLVLVNLNVDNVWFCAKYYFCTKRLHKETLSQTPLHLLSPAQAVVSWIMSNDSNSSVVFYRNFSLSIRKGRGVNRHRVSYRTWSSAKRLLLQRHAKIIRSDGWMDVDMYVQRLLLYYELYDGVITTSVEVQGMCTCLPTYVAHAALLNSARWGKYINRYINNSPIPAADHVLSLIFPWASIVVHFYITSWWQRFLKRQFFIFSFYWIFDLFFCHIAR